MCDVLREWGKMHCVVEKLYSLQLEFGQPSTWPEAISNVFSTSSSSRSKKAIFPSRFAFAFRPTETRPSLLKEYRDHLPRSQSDCRSSITDGVLSRFVTLRLASSFTVEGLRGSFERVIDLISMSSMTSSTMPCRRQVCPIEIIEGCNWCD